MNSPYNLPLDQTSRNSISMSQPVLTRSLPSVAVSIPMTLDNVIVSGIHHSYVPSPANVIGTQSRTPITVIGGIGDGNISQKQAPIQNCFQNPQQFPKYSPPVMSTARPIAVPQQTLNYSSIFPSTKYLRRYRNATTHMLKVADISQCTYPPIRDDTRVPLLLNKTRSGSVTTIGVSTSYSNLIKRGRSFSQILDKSKKKTKSRMKTKYLLKIVKIDETTSPGESVLTFEMMTPKSQMRFTCCLNKGINNLEVLNSVGEYGQIPGELGKKDIIESLVNTVRKMCHQLTDDLNSIALNDEYIFHPCLPNVGLLKLSDFLMTDPDLYTTLNSNQSLQPSSNFSGSCASSRSLSRHPSSEDLSGPIVGGQSMALVEQLSTSVMDYESNKPIQDQQKKMMKVAIDNDCNMHTIVSTKCICPIGDSVFKVPEYIFPYVKQIVDKLLNHSCKGLIILPQSNDILTRNVRILEIPADHMFIGLPCADSSYNIIKAQKDKDFIIARDNRDPERSSDKCVYQKPADSVVLLDSSGEIQHILTPTLVVPPKPGYENRKTTVKELPSELTHRKDQSLDCDQIVSVLQSLTHIQNNADQSKDELFDSPVMLEPVKNLFPKTQPNLPEKPDGSEYYGRRGSDESVTLPSQQQSQIQVERIYCEYVPIHKASDVRHDDCLLSVGDHPERDLPKQQVRSRKISNESLDSIAAIRNRAASTVTCVNEADLVLAQTGQQKASTNMQMNAQKSASAVPFVNDPDLISTLPSHQKVISGNQPMNFQGSQKSLGASTGTYINDSDLIQSQGGLQKLLASNQMSLQNSQIPISAIRNPIPLQRMPNVTGQPAPGQFVLSNPNSGNIFIQNVPAVPIYNGPNQGPGGPIMMPQSNTNIPGILSNQSSAGVNYPSHICMNQMHQIQQNAGQRLVTPSSISTSSLSSSQLMSNMPPMAPTIMPTPVYPVFTDQAHPELVDQSFTSLGRQMPPMANIRQMPQAGSSQFIDQSMIAPIMAENIRIQLKNQPPIAPNAQPQLPPPLTQATPVLIIPHPSMAQTVVGTNIKTSAPTEVSLIPQLEYPHPLQPTVSAGSDADSKPKSEQVVGRFVIRPVTDSTENS